MPSKLAVECYNKGEMLFQGLKQITNVTQRIKTLQACQEWFSQSLEHGFDLKTIYRLGLIYKGFMEIETDEQKRRFYKVKAFQHLIPEKFREAKSKDFPEKLILQITKERGDLYLLDGQFEDALIEYSKCRQGIKKEEIYPDVWISLGVAYENLDDIDLAMHYYSEYLSLNAEKNLKNAQVRRLLANLQFQKQKFKEGIENLETALESMGEVEELDKLSCYQSLGSAYLCRKDMDKDKAKCTDKALGFFQKILDQVPNDPAANYGKGLCYTKQDKYAEAQNIFVQAYEQDSEFSLAILGEARLQYKQGNNEKTKDLVENALKLDPEQAAALKQKGKALKKLNDKDWIPTMNKADAQLVQQGITSGSKSIQDCREQEGNIEGKTNYISAKLDENQIELVEKEIQKVEEGLKSNKDVDPSELNKLQLLQARICLKKVTNHGQLQQVVNEQIQVPNMVGQVQIKTDQKQEKAEDIASDILTQKGVNLRDSGNQEQVEQYKLLGENQKNISPQEIVLDQSLDGEKQKLKSLVETLKDNPEPCICLGLSQFSLKQYEESLSQFEESKKRLKDPKYRDQQQIVWLKRMEEVTYCCLFLVESRILLDEKQQKISKQQIEEKFKGRAERLNQRMANIEKCLPQNQIKILKKIFDVIGQKHKKWSSKEIYMQEKFFRQNFTDLTDEWFRLGHDLLYSTKQSDIANIDQKAQQEEQRVERIQKNQDEFKQIQEKNAISKSQETKNELMKLLKTFSQEERDYQEKFEWALKQYLEEKGLYQSNKLFQGNESQKSYDVMWKMTKFSDLVKKDITVCGEFRSFFIEDHSDAKFEEIQQQTEQSLNQLIDLKLARAEVEFQIFKTSVKILESEPFKMLFKILKTIPINSEFEGEPEVFKSFYISPKPGEGDKEIQQKEKTINNTQLKDYQVERAFLHVQQIASGIMIDWTTAYRIEKTNGVKQTQPNPKKNNRGTNMLKPGQVANDGSNHKKLVYQYEWNVIKSSDQDDQLFNLIMNIAIYLIVREANQINEFKDRINNKQFNKQASPGCFGFL